jgi:hypothetical protein
MGSFQIESPAAANLIPIPDPDVDLDSIVSEQNVARMEWSTAFSLRESLHLVSDPENLDA